MIKGFLGHHYQELLMGKFLLEEAGKMVCEAMCRESHVLDILHTIYIFDVQRGLVTIISVITIL